MNGPPPASSADLAAIARRFVGSQGASPRLAARASVGETDGETESARSAVSGADSFEEARTPTGASSRPETAPTSVDDLVDRAVERANAFSDAQVRAFGEACAQSRWCAVNKLAGDEGRFFSVSASVLGLGVFVIAFFRFGCGHFFYGPTEPAWISGRILLANGE